MMVIIRRKEWLWYVEVKEMIRIGSLGAKINFFVQFSLDKKNLSCFKKSTILALDTAKK